MCVAVYMHVRVHTRVQVQLGPWFGDPTGKGAEQKAVVTCRYIGVQESVGFDL